MEGRLDEDDGGLRSSPRQLVSEKKMVPVSVKLGLASLWVAGASRRCYVVSEGRGKGDLMI